MADLSDYELYFRDNFNTELSEEDEFLFQAWLERMSELKGRDMSMDLVDYDHRGFWQDGITQGYDDPDAHGTDRYKKPSHPTFSNESIYHNTPNNEGDGDRWYGGSWSNDGTQYTPSREMLNSTHPQRWLEQHFKKYKPDVELMLHPR